jgi:hypothetical protein
MLIRVNKLRPTLKPAGYSATILPPEKIGLRSRNCSEA